MMKHFEIFNSKKYNYFFYAISAFFAAIAVYSFVTTPFTGDLMVFFASANQVQYQDSSGLLAVFESWELKGVGNRLFIYIIYVISSAIAGFNNKIAFEITASAVYALFLLAVFALSAYLLPIERKQKISLFALLFFAFFSVHMKVQMQAEMTCAALCILGAALLISGKKYGPVAAGLIGSLLFFFKSICIVMFGMEICCDVLFFEFKGKKHYFKDMVISVIAMIAFEIAFAGLVFAIYPQEFADMLNASNFQDTLLSGLGNISVTVTLSRFYNHLVSSAIAIPMLIVGIAAAISVTPHLIKGKNILAFLGFAGLWIAPLSILVVSNNYSDYHYFPFIFPCVVSVILFFCITDINKKIIFPSIIGASALTLVINLLKLNGFLSKTVFIILYMFILVFAAISYFIHRNRKLQHCFALISAALVFFTWTYFYSFMGSYHQNLKKVNKTAFEISTAVIPDDFGEEPVLYLDDGRTAFFADAKSYSRYYFNLPMQRWEEGDDWAIQKEQHELILNYSGKYIAYSGWFGLEKFPDIEHKLKTEYSYVDGAKLYTKAISADVFNLKNPPPDGYNVDVYILVRNN